MRSRGMPRGEEITLLQLGSVRQIAGRLIAKGLSFGIVASRFNEELTHALVEAAVACLREHGADDRSILIVWVPGAYEVPAVIHRLARRKEFSALIALGAVIEGETPHADMINRQITHSLAAISREFDVPVIHEVVAVRNEKQAIARCKGGRGSRGWYAGRAAIEMANLYRQMG